MARSIDRKSNSEDSSISDEDELESNSEDSSISDQYQELRTQLLLVKLPLDIQNKLKNADSVDQATLNDYRDKLLKYNQAKDPCFYISILVEGIIQKNNSFSDQDIILITRLKSSFLDRIFSIFEKIPLIRYFFSHKRVESNYKNYLTKKASLESSLNFLWKAIDKLYCDNFSITTIKNIGTEIEKITSLDILNATSDQDETVWDKVLNRYRLSNTPDEALRKFKDVDLDVDLKDIIDFLKQKIRPDIRNKEGNTIIHQTIKGEAFNLAQTFIESFLDAQNKDFLNAQNKKGETALHLLCNCKSENHADEKLNMIKDLLRKGARIDIPDNQGNTVIHQTIQFENFDLTQTFIESISNDQNKDFLNTQNKEGETALHLLSNCKSENHAEKKLNMIKDLLRKGARIDIPDNQGNTVIHQTIQFEDFDLAQTFIESFSDDQNKDFLNAQNKKGETALHLLCNCKSNNDADKKLNMIKDLLQQGARIDIPDNNGNTVIHQTIKFEAFNLVQTFIESFSDAQNKDFLNAQNKKGETALHLVCSCKSKNHADTKFKMIMYLLKKGACINILDKKENKVLDNFIQNSLSPLEKALKKQNKHEALRLLTKLWNSIHKMLKEQPSEEILTKLILWFFIKQWVWLDESENILSMMKSYPKLEAFILNRLDESGNKSLLDKAYQAASTKGQNNWRTQNGNVNKNESYEKGTEPAVEENHNSLITHKM